MGRGPMQGRGGPPTGPRGFSGAVPGRLRNAKGNLPSEFSCCKSKYLPLESNTVMCYNVF